MTIGDDSRTRNEFNINIRLATQNDTSSILKIVDNVLFKNEKLPDYSGFLVFKPKQTEYIFRLKNNRFRFIAEKDNMIVGFIVSFTNEEILMNLKRGYLKYEDKLFKYCMENSEKFIWLDQLAIYPKKYRRAKIGTILTERVLEEAATLGYHDIFGSISLCPDFNIPSLHFISKFNLKIVHSEDIEGRKWGIFHGNYI
jgi:predicted GNAT superfamily acetyltransferase